MRTIISFSLLILLAVPLAAREKESFGLTPEEIFAGATLPARSSGILWSPDSFERVGGPAPDDPWADALAPYGLSRSAPLSGGLSPQRTGAAGITPLTPGGKFKLAMKRTFYPGPVVGAAATAGWAMLVDSELDEGFGMGADGFARRWVFRLAFNGTKQVVATFALASALRQDPRYHLSNKRRFWERVGYAVSRVVVTRSDAGEPQFNASLVLGTAAAAAASVGYVRDQDASGGEAARRFGLSLALGAAKNVFREFFTQGD